MKFFRKLKEKLFSTSSKIKDGLEGIIDNQSIENVQEEQSKQDKLDKNLSQKINENFEQKKEKTLEESHKNNIKIDKTKSLVSVSNKSKELPNTVEKIQKTSSSKKTGIFSKIIKTVEKVTKKRKLDDKMLNEIEDLLISSDIGVSTASLIVEKIKKENFSKELDIKQLKQLISDEIYEIMNVSDSFLKIKEDQLNIWLFVGVNGSGKTTTIGKIAKQEKDNGKKVILAAADTFRAAAVDQLSIWSKRVGIEMVKGEEKSDPASVVYKAIEEAKLYYASNDRGKMIMACGTGKTYTSLKIAEAIANKKFVLYMVPSLALMSQSIREWKNDCEEEFIAFSACSDKKVGKVKSDNDQIQVKLNELGYDFDERNINKLFKQFKNLADKKKQVFEEDLYAMVESEKNFQKKMPINLIDLSLKCGQGKNAEAKLKLEIFGEKKLIKEVGNGPIDAIFNALKALIPNKANLIVYQVNAITKGTDAQAEVNVRLEEKSISVQGQGSDIDTMVASAKAYINAMNKLILKRKRANDSKSVFQTSNEKLNKHVI